MACYEDVKVLSGYNVWLLLFYILKDTVFLSVLVQSMYINIDDFKSRLMVLSRHFDPDYQAKQVLNHDFSFSRSAGATHV